MLSADRDAFQSELVTAEDWLYDNFDATKVRAFVLQVELGAQYHDSEVQPRQ